MQEGNQLADFLAKAFLRRVMRTAPRVKHDRDSGREPMPLPSQDLTKAAADAVSDCRFADRPGQRESKPDFAGSRARGRRVGLGNGGRVNGPENKRGEVGTRVLTTLLVGLSELGRSKEAGTLGKRLIGRRSRKLLRTTDGALIAHRQLPTAACAAARKDRTAVDRLHPLAEAVNFRALAIVRLECTFWHSKTSGADSPANLIIGEGWAASQSGEPAARARPAPRSISRGRLPVILDIARSSNRSSPLARRRRRHLARLVEQESERFVGADARGNPAQVAVLFHL